MTLYIENSKNSTQNLLNLINKFCTVEGYKINIQKSISFLYTTNEISEKEFKVMLKKKLSFKVTSQKWKYWGINLTKEVKDLYAENYSSKGN